MFTAFRIITNQSRNVKVTNSDYRQEIQILSKPVEGLTNKTNNLRKSNTKHDIFIDIETFKPFTLRRIEKSKEYIHHRHLKKRKQPQSDKPFTVKNAMTSLKSLSTQVQFKNQISFRRSPMVFAKILTPSSSQDTNAKFNSKKQYKNKRSNGNQTRNSLKIKKKVLTQLQKLENDIKVVKGQIENDTRTIEDLQKKLRQKETEHAIKRVNEKTTISLDTDIGNQAITILTKNLDNDKTITTEKNEDYYMSYENTKKLQELTKTIKNQVTMNETNISDSNKLYKSRILGNVTKRDNLKIISKNIDTNKVDVDDRYKDVYIDGIQQNENRRNSTTKGKYDIKYITIYKNISNEENVENITVSTPSIFDLHEDFETFERFDGEFDWEKFVTSEMYIQIIKNSTAEPNDFRRMLTDEKRPTTISDLSEAVTSLAEKFMDDYYIDLPIPDRPKVVPLNSYNSKTSLVPRPSRRKGFLETMTTALPENEKSLNSDIDHIVRDDYLDNPSGISVGQYGILANRIYGRRNMPTLPTFRTTVDQILYDSLIRDIDKAIER